MGELLHLVWAKCPAAEGNRPPTKSQCNNYHISLWWSPRDGHLYAQWGQRGYMPTLKASSNLRVYKHRPTDIGLPAAIYVSYVYARCVTDPFRPNYWLACAAWSIQGV